MTFALPQFRFPFRHDRRQGMATLVVLLLISIALALSYSIMRSQSTTAAIQRNSHLAIEARMAAMAGINVGLKRMHVWDENNPSRRWGGVGTTLKMQLDSRTRFEVRYATGDPSLTVDDPWLEKDSPTLRSDRDDQDEFPYRVTLFATGIAVAPGDSSREVRHKMRAVVRLVPRALGTNKPAGFDRIVNGVGGNPYTLYQSSTGDCRINVPFRVKGRVRFQSRLDLALSGSSEPWYSWSNDARVRYLKDLNAMRSVGYLDHRPFDGPIELPHAQQDSSLLGLLAAMDISAPNAAAQSLSGWNVPSSMTTYQLYPGGKGYRVTTLDAEQRNATWKPDPVRNPAGIFYSSGQLRLNDNVRIQGTVISRQNDSGDILIAGRNVHLEPLSLPPLYGSSKPIQLPVIMAGDDLHLLEGAQAGIAGLVFSTDDFKITEDSQNASLSVQVSGSHAGKTLEAFLASVYSGYSVTEFRRMIRAGSVRVNGQISHDPASLVQSGQQVVVHPRIFVSRVVAKDIYVGGRSEWFLHSLIWNLQYTLFKLQDAVSDGIPWWPEWLDVFGLEKEPQYGIRPDASDPAPWYHWKNAYDPIYMPHPDDQGLCWELLEWTDNP